MSEAVEERRQRAREAGLDAAADDGSELDWGDKIDAAIETATRVQITDDVLHAFWDSWALSSSGTAALAAAFRAAGFEVVE